MVYPYWHPSGKYCAFSTNQTRQGFHVSPNERIEVFDLSSDVFVYNPATHEILTDSLLSTKDWSENSPVFSSDGRTLYYMTEIHNLQLAKMRKNIADLQMKGDTVQAQYLAQRADSFHLAYKNYTRRMAKNLKEGVLYDFLKEMYPLTYQRKYPDGRVVTINADTNEVGIKCSHVGNNWNPAQIYKEST